jgi:hypothetical protein
MMAQRWTSVPLDVLDSMTYLQGPSDKFSSRYDGTYLPLFRKNVFLGTFSLNGPYPYLKKYSVVESQRKKLETSARHFFSFRRHLWSFENFGWG